MVKSLLISIPVFIAQLCFAQTWIDASFDRNHPNFEMIKQQYETAKEEHPERLMGAKRFHRWEWLNRGRIQEDGSIRSHNDTYFNMKAYEALHRNNNREEMPTWWPIGPFDWSTAANSEAYNPGIGRVNAIRVDPTDENIIFIASASGGIWKSIDGGINWNTTMDALTILGTSDIAIAPNNSNIIYAGTGDRDGLSTFGIGVMKSIDGGATWSETDLWSQNPANGKIINRLAINPIKSTSLFALTPSGIYYTGSGGDDWDRVYKPSGITQSESYKNIVYHPTDTNTIYAVGTKLNISRDGGVTWSTNTNGINNNFGRAEIAVSADQPDLIYLLTTDSDQNFTGIYKSTDKGLNFTQKINASVNILGYDPEGNDDRSQANYDLAIAANPENANEFYTGGINLWYSRNGGSSIQNYNYWRYNDPNNYTHADIHFLNYQHGNIYCGSDGGIFISKDNGITWKDYSKNLNITQAYRIGIGQDNQVSYGSQDNGSGILNNHHFLHIYGGDGMESIIDPNDNDIVYVESQYGNIQKTEDGGETLRQKKPKKRSGAWVTPFIMNPGNSLELYVGYQELWKTLDGGNTWDSITTFANGSDIAALEIAWSDPDYIYLAKETDFYYTHDGGANWTIIVQPAGYISDIFIDPDDPLKIWLTSTNTTVRQVVYSEDGGVTFEVISDELPNLGAETITMDIEDPLKTLYIGMEVGVYYKTKDMTTWTRYGNVLPNVQVMELEIDYATRRMKAATYGRGIWEIKLDGDNSIQEDLNTTLPVSIYPNPCDNHFSVNFELNTPKQTQMILWGSAGQIIQKQEQTGRHVQANFSTKNLATGMYFFTISIDGKAYNHSIHVIH